MTIEFHFILHFANGLHIIIPQWCFSICTLIQILFSENFFFERHFSRAFVGRFFLLLDVILNSDWLTVDCNVLG